MGKLTAVAVKGAQHDPAKGKRPIRIGDGGGLYLQVAAANTKSWLFRYTLRGKAREMGLGQVGDGKGQVSLSEARKRAAAARADLESGRDPSHGSAALALRFIVLTALRSGEVRQARWSMLSFDGQPTLTIPGSLMKGKKSSDVQAHRVPMSRAALDVLAQAYGLITGTPAAAADLPGLAALRGAALIFPSTKRDVPLSDMSVSMVLRRMNKDRPDDALAPWRDHDGREAVPHGFRATFSTWVDDTRPEEREAAERALAHEVANKVSGVYRRSDLFDRRIALMAAWGEHCSRRQVGFVTKPAVADVSRGARRST